MPAQPLTLERLVRAVEQDAAIRRIRVLQPTGGPGDKIFPPTYPGERDTEPPRHVFEHRRLKGDDVLCVLVDSVQSQANRLEESLGQLRQKAPSLFPNVTVDFGETEVADLGSVSALEAPHRIYDAILRDSEIEGKPFRDSEDGKALALSKPQNATAVYKLAPTALVFGAWNSTGEGGGLGAKFPRAVVSEIVGIGVATNGQQEPDGMRPGSRIDPLGIRSGVKVWKSPDGNWSFDAPPKTDAGKGEPKVPKAARGSASKDVKASKKKEAAEVKPSEINHSNIAPSLDPLGVSVDHLQHTLVVSMAALRRLHFPDEANGARAADPYARAALAALALTAALAQDRAGYFLRSRCDLVPAVNEPVGFRLVMSDGKEEEVDVTLEGAMKLVQAAAAAAAKAGVMWREKDVLLKPQKKLVDLILRSRELALRGVAEEGS
ncbi:MAG TPA: type I-U CRISPR-associated RAMP protein Csb1/Cas7u [Polyangiaceae bacterium]|nr:type I-U CRISPR-associated RAMP protein Csb1/Cas7u [Polyangiaceae bacterium]